MTNTLAFSKVKYLMFSLALVAALSLVLIVGAKTAQACE